MSLVMNWASSSAAVVLLLLTALAIYQLSSAYFNGMLYTHQTRFTYRSFTCNIYSSSYNSSMTNLWIRDDVYVQLHANSLEEMKGKIRSEVNNLLINDLAINEVIKCCSSPNRK